MLRSDPYTLILITSALVSVAVGTASWRRRAQTPAAAALTMIMLCIVVWAGTEAVSQWLGDPGLLQIVGLVVIQAIALLVIGFHWLCRVMVDRSARYSRRAKALLAVEPVLVMVTAVTNPWHHGLIASAEINQDAIPTITPGPLFWPQSAYCYALLGWALIGVARAWRSASSLHRRQLRTMLIGAVFPIAANLLTLTAGSDGGMVDFSAIAFLVTGLVFAWALFRQGLLQLVPVARALVMERVSDAVVVLDLDGVVLDLNPAAVRLARAVRPDLPAELVGRMLWRPERAGAPFDEFQAEDARVVAADGSELDLDIRADRLTDRRGSLVGYAVVTRDVSEQVRQRRELAAVNTRLREQLAVIERLRADLAEQAVRDVLTGLHNRRYLMEMIEQEVAHAMATGDHLGVVLLDIDRFKAVNDRYGHVVGDQVLAAVGQALVGAARRGDTVARYGGEEFVVLLPGATLAQALARAQEWRPRCAAAVVPSSQGPVSSTFSAGVAALPGSGRSPEDLLRAADEALYAAKAAGRDRILPAVPLA